MQTLITTLLARRGIALCAPISLDHCEIIRPYLLERAEIRQGTAFLFAVPYYTTECDCSARNISSYAVSRDYHLFFRELFDEILPVLRAAFPAHRFAGFTDHSPIAEVNAAVRAGLGLLGCNHLLLTEDYSSYVFLGEIVTDAVLEGGPVFPLSQCDACGACRRACPADTDPARCLSALTQKKGTLDGQERRDLLAHGLAWGCDRCQESCPVTKKAKKAGSIYTTVPFFREKALPHLTSDTVRAMSDTEFAERAYSWRGRDVILRNLEILEKGEGR